MSKIVAAAFFAPRSLRCGDTVGMVRVAGSKGKKGWVSIARSAFWAIAQKTPQQAALFIQKTELFKTVKILFLIGLTY
ncbi:hypothetical protein [Tychonema sp. LEGE 07203]|uniref:hypothetical protein n=1 Tax=Tychonema sp. LEGE 07203 TaxID=1828671 RepID=UPI00188169C7|nr:hypothetical protein [Tychonema sp. LEGE 07203]MBE9096738.1 hypothetical protein [Tychonema sp. LEGE 07203]